MDAHTPPRRLWPAFMAGTLVLGAFAYVFGSTSGITTAPPPPTIPELAEPAPTTITTTSTTVATIPPAEVPPGWTLLPPGPLDPRIGHASVWTGDELVIWGGRSLLDKRSTGAVYDPPSGSWSEMPQAPISGGSQQALAWTGGELVALTSSAAVFDPLHQRWGKLAWDDTARVLAATASETEVLIVTRPPPGPDDALSAVRYVPGEPCCDLLPPPPIDLNYGSLFWTGDEFLLIGGDGAPQAGDATPRFASFDPETSSWTTLPEPPLKVRGPLTTSWTGSRLVMIDYLMRTAVWSEATGWERLPNAPFEYHGCIPRSTALPGGIVFTWYCRQAAIVDLDTESWTAIAVPQLDPHAVSTSCLPVTAGARVLMWCGNDPGTPMFWELDPSRVMALHDWEISKQA